MNDHEQPSQPWFRPDYAVIVPELDTLSACGWRAFEQEMDEIRKRGGVERQAHVESIINFKKANDMRRVNMTIAVMEAMWGEDS